jgi:hypothetical protein
MGAFAADFPRQELRRGWSLSRCRLISDYSRRNAELALCDTELPPASATTMQKKVFWALFIVFGTILDIVLPIMWGLLLTLPLLILCWWIAYRSGWFEE